MPQICRYGKCPLVIFPMERRRTLCIYKKMYQKLLLLLLAGTGLLHRLFDKHKKREKNPGRQKTMVEAVWCLSPSQRGFLCQREREQKTRSRCTLRRKRKKETKAKRYRKRENGWLAPIQSVAAGRTPVLPRREKTRREWEGGRARGLTSLLSVWMAKQMRELTRKRTPGFLISFFYAFKNEINHAQTHSHEACVEISHIFFPYLSARLVYQISTDNTPHQRQIPR